MTVWYVSRDRRVPPVPAELRIQYSPDSLRKRKVRLTTPFHVVTNLLLMGETAQQVLLGTRTRVGRWLGYLETPGGKQEPGEDAYAASTREFQEEMGLNLPFLSLRHRFTLPLPEAGELATFETFVYSFSRDQNWTPDLNQVSDRSHCATVWLNLANVAAWTAAGRLTPGTAKSLQHVINNRIFEDL